MTSIVNVICKYTDFIIIVITVIMIMVIFIIFILTSN